jgi:hypothetical protein
MSNVNANANANTSSVVSLLEQFKGGQMTAEQVQVELEKLKLKDVKKLTYKVSQKGAISFYGIRRMPITLYLEELEQIVEAYNTDEFRQYISANKDSFSTKKPKS